MKIKQLVLFFVAILFIFAACNQKKMEKLNYPITKKTDTIDEYFGVKIADPYRWLEDDKSEETGLWVEAQNKITFGYLEKIPYRQKIKDRITQMWNYPKFGTPFKKGNYYFFFKNDGLQNQSVLYIQEGLTGEPRVFLDPNKLSDDGTVALGGMSISNDHKYFAYQTASSGSDWNEIFVIEIASGKKMNDHIKWVKFSGAEWYKDGFYYSCYDAPKKGSELSNKNEFHKIYYHKLGTQQSEDVLVYENKKYPLRNYSMAITDDESFAFIYETETTSGNALYFKKTEDKNGKFTKIAEGFDYNYHIIDNVGDKLLLFTNWNAPKNQLLLIDAPYTDTAKWKAIIPESGDVLEGINLIGGKIIATYMKDAANHAYVYSIDGKKEFEVELPGIGSLGGFSGEKKDPLAFYSFTSFTYPSTIFKYDVNNNKSEVYKKPEIDFNPEDYETKQVFFPSKDGTKIPLFIVHKKGLKLDGNNPTLLYGYGGFNVSLTPSFSISRLVLLENGGVYALANLRGGGEYGKEWHEAGTKLKKQNVFDDFIAAGEYLIKEKYTSSQKLAIQGGSNGGLLVGACMLQRPDLYRVAFPAVGVLDMLRFHKFTIGWAWVGDYGSSDDSTQFHYILKYSPLHNIKENTDYPATLVTTADHDDRVVPAHSFKFIATLQEKYKGNNPVLIRIETKAGHGAGKPTSKVIEEAADLWSFMFYNMSITPKY